MTSKHFYMPSDFANACIRFAEAGFTIDEANYTDRAFGSWTLQISKGGLAPHLVMWDGRDRWLILQSKDSSDQWVDEWVVREPQEDSIDQIIGRLVS